MTTCVLITRTDTHAHPAHHTHAHSHFVFVFWSLWRSRVVPRSFSVNSHSGKNDFCRIRIRFIAIIIRRWKWTCVFRWRSKVRKEEKFHLRYLYIFITSLSNVLILFFSEGTLKIDEKQRKNIRRENFEKEIIEFTVEVRHYIWSIL